MDAPRPTSEQNRISTTSELAADVRLRRIEASARSPHQRAHADIGVDDILWLVARVTDLEAKLAKGWDEVVANDKARAIRAEIALEAAEAQVAALTQERDKWKNRAEYEEDQKRIVAHAHLEEQARAVSAEAQTETTRQALTEIDIIVGDSFAQVSAIVRRALAATEPK